VIGGDFNARFTHALLMANLFLLCVIKNPNGGEVTEYVMFTLLCLGWSFLGVWSASRKSLSSSPEPKP
jgi:hypothetical protein